MSTTHNLKGIIAGALLSGGLAVAGLGLGAATAQAGPDGPHRWCPGQTMNLPTGPGPSWTWDMSVCHTFYFVGYAQGNVPSNYGAPSYIWEGDNPPAPIPQPWTPLPGL
jgi:hypothetical protein